MSKFINIPIPLRVDNDKAKYLQDTLIRDGSVILEGSGLVNLLDCEDEIKQLPHVEVRYEVTDHCNASCIMCPREEHRHGREHGIMEQNKYERSIDEVVSLGARRVVLTGFGEPLLDYNLEQKIIYAKKKGLKTYFITNGSMLTNKRSRTILKSGLDEIRVSFYGMGSDTYNSVMRGLDYEKTNKALLTFLELRDLLGVSTTVQLSYLVMPENEKDIEVFREYWEPRVEAIEIWRPHNFGDGRDYRERSDDSLIKRTCGRPMHGPLQIQWNGEVVPCCYDYNNKIVLGNAFEQPVLEIFNGIKYRMLRYAHQKGKFEIFPYCDQCDQLLPHADALVSTNRHSLPPEEAVKLSSTDLYNIIEHQEMDEQGLSDRYRYSK